MNLSMRTSYPVYERRAQLLMTAIMIETFSDRYGTATELAESWLLHKCVASDGAFQLTGGIAFIDGWMEKFMAEAKFKDGKLKLEWVEHAKQLIRNISVYDYYCYRLLHSFADLCMDFTEAEVEQVRRAAEDGTPVGKPRNPFQLEVERIIQLETKKIAHEGKWAFLNFTFALPEDKDAIDEYVSKLMAKSSEFSEQMPV